MKSKKCMVKVCKNAKLHNSLCKSHYDLLRKTGSVNFKKLPTHFGNNLNFLRGKGGKIPCKVPKCEGRYYARTLCRSHYLQWLHTRVAENNEEKCVIRGCKLKKRVKEMCAFHYQANHCHASVYNFQAALKSEL